MNEKRKVVSVIGPSGSSCDEKIYAFGMALGSALIDHQFRIMCGGMDGVMEAVCKGAHKSDKYVEGCTTGIIPTLNKADANPYCDVVIPTGLSMARNQLVVNSGDVVVAVAGGAGTLSEIAFAWQLGKQVICYTGFEGWSKNLAGTNIDGRKKGLLLEATSLHEIIRLCKECLSSKG